jgi:hypothetical protein
MHTFDETRRQHLMRTVRGYFEACNAASRERFAEVLAAECIHYFPPGTGGPYRGRDAIADLWIGFVRDKGSCWTIDRMVCDGRDLVVEWSHFKPRVGERIRGSEWYAFDDHGQISHIWAHYASPRDTERAANELEGFDYAARGYPMQAPELDEATRDQRRRNLLDEAGRAGATAASAAGAGAADAGTDTEHGAEHGADTEPGPGTEPGTEPGASS